MHVRTSILASAFLVVLSLTGACERSDSGATLQVGMTGPSAVQADVLSVEPSVLAPEFLASSFCPALPPFRTRFNLVFRTERDLLLRQLRFEFLDRASRRVLPAATPIPSSTPRSIPASPPIPIPGTLPFHGVTLSGGVSALGLLLEFGCGITPEGTLFIDVETADDDGAPAVSHVMVRVGGR